MKSRKLILILLLVLILLAIAAAVASHFLRPVVIVENNTDQPVHLFATQSEEGSEPTLDEIERRNGTITLAPGESKTFSLPLSNLLSSTSKRLDSGWRVGQDNTGTRYSQVFVTSETQGYCTARILVGESGFMLLEGPLGHCYKKWVPLWPDR